MTARNNVVVLPVGPLAEATASYARRRAATDCEVFGCQPHHAGRSHRHTRLHRAFGEAAACGQAPLELVEDVCDLLLGQHARMLYGRAWDQAADRAAGHTLPNRREGTRSGYSGGCRCGACCRANAAYITSRRRAAHGQPRPRGGEAA